MENLSWSLIGTICQQFQTTYSLTHGNRQYSAFKVLWDDLQFYDAFHTPNPI